jgi:hypothetical protein
MKRILTAVLGLSLLAAPVAAFARTGGGDGFHGGGFHAAPAAGFHGGSHAVPAAGSHGSLRAQYRAPVRVAPAPVVVPRGGVRVAPRPGFYGPVWGVHPAGNRVWINGYWGFRGGVRTWYGPSWSYAPYAGWVWVAPHWAWNGFTWVWQTGYWAPPV